ncbi:hypothetical protein ES705_51016 [subsurface metagenome]
MEVLLKHQQWMRWRKTDYVTRVSIQLLFAHLPEWQLRQVEIIILAIQALLWKQPQPTQVIREPYLIA